MTPPANTGKSSVCAMWPMIGTMTIRNMSTSRISVMPIHVPGAAAKMRHPSPHHEAP